MGSGRRLQVLMHWISLFVPYRRSEVQFFLLVHQWQPQHTVVADMNLYRVIGGGVHIILAGGKKAESETMAGGQHHIHGKEFHERSDGHTGN